MESQQISIIILIITATAGVIITMIFLIYEYLKKILELFCWSKGNHIKLFIFKWLHNYWLDYEIIKNVGFETYKELKSVQKEKVDKSFIRIINYIYITTSICKRYEYYFSGKNETNYFNIHISNAPINPIPIITCNWDNKREWFQLNKYKDVSDAVKEFFYLFEEEIIEFLNKDHSRFIKFMKEEINKNKEYLDKKSNDEYYIAAEDELEKFLKQEMELYV